MPSAPTITLTPRILTLVAQIAGVLGRWERAGRRVSPQLRRGNRIRTVQASLAIEANSLSLDEVESILEGKPIVGPPREILEVKNALACYEAMDAWSPFAVKDFLAAHRLLMQGLVSTCGLFRTSGVGIYQGAQLLHMAPPYAEVPALVKSLLAWGKKCGLHPLVLSTVMHYQIEFIHPFSDGNGRMGRLWQTLTLLHWNPALGCVPVESLVKERQAAYYNALRQSDTTEDAAPFVEFMLDCLLVSVSTPVAPNTTPTRPSTDPLNDQVSDYVSDQAKRLLLPLKKGLPLSLEHLMAMLKLKHRASFRLRYLQPALDAGYVEMTQPLSPRSPTQRYKITPLGQRQVNQPKRR